MNKLIPRIRIFLQVSLLVLVIISPMFQLVRTFRQDPYPYVNSPLIRNETTRKALSSIDHNLRDMLGDISEKINGGSYTLGFFGIHFSEPLTITTYSVNQLWIGKNWSWTMIITLCFAVLIILLFGRFYCGFVCPMSLITSLNIKLQKKYLKRRVRFSGTWLRPLKFFRVLYIIVLMLLILTHPIVLQYILPPALLQHLTSDFILFGGGALWLLLFTAVLIFEISLPGRFCRLLCPTGNFLSYLGKFRKIHLHHKMKTDCLTGCNICISECWLGLSPKTKVDDPACDLCGRCASPCPQSRIRYLPAIIFLGLFSFFEPTKVIAGTWDDKETYHEQIMERVLFESRSNVNFQHTNTTGFILFSIVGNYTNKLQSGKFYIHINENKKTFNEKIKLILTNKKNGKTIKKIIEGVSRPISIRVQSAYFTEYLIKGNTSYNLKIESDLGSFDSVDFNFEIMPLRI